MTHSESQRHLLKKLSTKVYFLAFQETMKMLKQVHVQLAEARPQSSSSRQEERRLPINNIKTQRREGFVLGGFKRVSSILGCENRNRAHTNQPKKKTPKASFRFIKKWNVNYKH